MAVVTLSMFPLKMMISSTDTRQTLANTPNFKNPKPLSPSSTSQILTSTIRTDSTLPILSSNGEKQGKVDETYMGYHTWSPNPPKVQKPPSVHSAASLAFIGDSIYELYARRHFLFPPLSIEEYNDRVMKVARCEAQAALLKKLTEDDFLTKKERDILRWGKNVISSSKTRTKKRAGLSVYNKASSLETLIGHLYLTNKERLEEVMIKLGFSVGDSAKLNLEESEESE